MPVTSVHSPPGPVEGRAKVRAVVQHDDVDGIALRFPSGMHDGEVGVIPFPIMALVVDVRDRLRHGRSTQHGVSRVYFPVGEGAVGVCNRRMKRCAATRVRLVVTSGCGEDN